MSDTLTIFPCETWAVIYAAKVFGFDCVNPGSWMSHGRVRVSDLPPDDLAAGIELLREVGVTLK